jgi:hypothetical protein
VIELRAASWVLHRPVAAGAAAEEGFGYTPGRAVDTTLEQVVSESTGDIDIQVSAAAEHPGAVLLVDRTGGLLKERGSNGGKVKIGDARVPESDLRRKIREHIDLDGHRVRYLGGVPGPKIR